MSEGTMTVGGIFYFYPARQPDPRAEMWQQGLSNPAVEYFVANPGSGPGDAMDANWKTMIDAGIKAGKVPLGYISTKYGAVSESSIKSQLDKYLLWYGIGGCFYDEASQNVGQLDYYKRLYNMVPGRVVINPGAIPPEGYTKAADTICLFESTIDKWKPETWPAWIRKYPRDKWFAIVMGCNQAQAEAVCKSGAYVGSIYPIERIDSQTVDGFEVLPPYFSMIPRWLKIPEPAPVPSPGESPNSTEGWSNLTLQEVAAIVGMGPDSTLAQVPAEVLSIVHRNRALEAQIHNAITGATDEEILADVLRRLKRL